MIVGPFRYSNGGLWYRIERVDNLLDMIEQSALIDVGAGRPTCPL